MNSIPKRYAWLLKEPGPKMILEALRLFGTHEVAGPGNNAAIIGWASETGLRAVYTADSIPWCGLFMAVVAKRAGKEFPKNPLWALSWSSFGDDCKTPELGDVLVFTRKGGGHVGLYVGEDTHAYHVLGGNQSNSVNITRIAKSRLYIARRPEYRIATPPNVRKITLFATGSLSTNEA